VLIQGSIDSNSGVVIAEFSELRSGRRDNRPELSKAETLPHHTRGLGHRAAWPDRLSRDVDMIARLMETELEFVAVDFPRANRFTIHILAAIAEFEFRSLRRGGRGLTGWHEAWRRLQPS
jgi:hypothetical protein